MHTADDPRESNFTFETSTKKSVTFSGPLGDSSSSALTRFSLIKTVTMTKGEESTDFPASGRCLYGDPFAGRTTISCEAELKEGRKITAVFLTNGKKPAVGNEVLDYLTAAEPPLPQIPQSTQSAPVEPGSVQQGYAPEPEFGKVESIQLEGIATFSLTVCNRTGRKIVLAFHTKYNNLLIDESYAVHGWYTAPAQKCTVLGDFPPTDFAFYANNESGREWTGKDYSLCVESERFKRIVYNETKCTKLLRKGFTALKIDSREYTLTLR